MDKCHLSVPECERPGLSLSFFMWPLRGWRGERKKKWRPNLLHPVLIFKNNEVKTRLPILTEERLWFMWHSILMHFFFLIFHYCIQIETAVYYRPIFFNNSGTKWVFGNWQTNYTVKVTLWLCPTVQMRNAQKEHTSSHCCHSSPQKLKLLSVPSKMLLQPGMKI